MRIAYAVFFLSILCSPSLTTAAQAPAPASTSGQTAPAPTPAPGPQAPVAAPAPIAPSGMLQPAITTVQQTLNALQLDRWKRGTIREEAATEIGSILQDLKENVPPLLQDADAAPGALSRMLPLSRHLDALYDVLLRVEEASRVAAPGEQVDQLQHALSSLGDARLAMDKSMQEAAVEQEKQVSDLRIRLQAQAAVKCPPPPPPPVCPAPPKRKPLKKRKPPTTTTPQKSPAPATTTPKPGI
ncbi:MAG: hypothetical protein KGM96_15630 [Acidobacteriota bacterium]|nr:hypothetical protein [Acidobacteriota bacterium]